MRTGASHRHIAFCLAWLILAAVLLPTSAFAHGAEGGIVLLLPTGYYLAGAALAVAASFALLAILPARLVDRAADMRLRLVTIPDVPHALTSLITFIFLAFLILAGFVGLNLMQSSLTGFCPAESMLRRLGVQSCAARSK